VLIACLKTFYVGEGQYLVVTRHNFQSMLKNLPGGKHNGFKMWLAHQNTELGIECSVGHAVEACVWVLQQLHLVSADFESSRFFPQWCRLWDLIRLEAIDHELLVAAWGNRCLVMINGENPVNKLWTYSKLADLKPFWLDGCYCDKRHFVYSQTRYKKRPAPGSEQWDYALLDVVVDGDTWEHHPLRKDFRMWSPLGIAPSPFKPDFGPICGKQGYQCPTLVELGKHRGAVGATRGALGNAPFLEYFKNAIAWEVCDRLKDKELQIASHLFGVIYMEDSDIKVLEAPGGQQSYSAVFTGGVDCLSLDIHPRFKIPIFDEDRDGYNFTDVTCDLNQVSLLSVISQEYGFGTTSSDGKVILIHSPSPCDAQGSLNYSNGVWTADGQDPTGPALRPITAGRELAMHLWLKEADKIHQAMFRPRVVVPLGGRVGVYKLSSR
jgi:hypothetical protein